MIQGENSREVLESRSKLLLFGNLIKKKLFTYKRGEEGARSLASSARGKEEANPLF